MDHLLSGSLKLPPLGGFALLVLLALIVPPLCRRLRLPDCVGFILCGVLVGPHLLELIPAHAPAMETLADLGKLLLMFFVGMEIDLKQFNAERRRAMLFGLATFLLPMLAGLTIGLGFGYSLVAAMVVGSLLSSHTLIAYGQVTAAGAQNRPAVTITVGATVLTDMLSLLVLAGCLATHRAGFDAPALLVQTAKLVGFTAFMILALGPATRWLIPRLPLHGGRRGVMLVMLAVVSLSALLAEALQLEGIIGAFLSGIAINRAVEGSAEKATLEGIGHGFAIPAFFIAIGFLVDLRVMGEVLTREVPLVLAIVLGLVAAKWTAAHWMGRHWQFSGGDRWLMASLTMPQVAATLAATLVATQTFNPAGVPLLDSRMLNTVLVLVVATSILGPILTQLHLAPNDSPATDAPPAP